MANLLLLLSLGILGCTRAQQCYFAGPRVDCGFVGITADQCTAQGCCWAPAEFQGGPHIDLPWCFYSNNEPSSYAVTQSSPNQGKTSTQTGGRGGGGSNSGNLEATLQLKESTLPQLGADIQHLKASVKEIASGIVRFRLTDADKERWQVPPTLFPPDSFAGGGESLKPTDEANVQIVWDDSPFALRISSLDQKKKSIPSAATTTTALPTETDTVKQTIFDSTGLRLVFKDQYIELSTYVDSDATLYGAGERSSNSLHLLRNGMPRTLWNQDKGPTFLEQNSYGSYPFVMALHKTTGNAWGYFMLSSNGMEIVPTTDRLSWRIIGGMIDFYIFTGPTPGDVLDQLTQVVGRPTLMPYWSLGWQQSKYGYKSIWEIEEVVAKYAENGLPLETIVTDIDHMDHWRDFTFDPVNYPLEEMQRFVAELEKKGQKWVPIVDPGIFVPSVPGMSYEPYDAGIKENIFLKEYDGKTPYLGWVWPGPTHFPDFMSTAGQLFLKKFLTTWHAAVPFSGIWIDMNEASNFCTGDACTFPIKEQQLLSKNEINNKDVDDDDPPPWVCQLDCTKDIRPELNTTMRSFLDPPYAISNSLNRQNLGTKGISVLAQHLDGSLQYNTHNVYGLAECQATFKAVQEITGKRPFVLSRSSFTGVGAYAAHWTGDNAATWEDMARSLPAILNYGLQGIPFGGADTGFQGDISEELCARWVSVSAIAYPFARSHSDLHSRHQEPYLWPSVLQAAKKSLEMRYKLLSYFYTLLRIASEKGMPVMRPLWLNYPQVEATHQIDKQVMLGDALLVTPVLMQGAEKVKGYFPAGTVWYDMFEKSENIDTRLEAKEVEVSASISSIPVPLHMAGGTIVAMHTFENQSASSATASLVTAQVRRSPLILVVALKHPVGASTTAKTAAEETQSAEGFMFLDDGESVHSLSAAADCNFLKFSAKVRRGEENSSLASVGEVNISFGVPEGFRISDNIGREADVLATCQGFEWPELHKVKILGWQKSVSEARLELVQQGEDAAGDIITTDLAWNIGENLEFSIPKGSKALNYPLKLALTWSSAAAGEGAGDGAEQELLLRGKLQEGERELAATY